MNISSIPIYIPSYMRAGVSVTEATMRALGFKKFIYAVHAFEEEFYKAAYPKSELLILPNNETGIGKARQAILDNADDKLYMMMDDDVTGFSYKKDIEKLGGMKRATNRQVLTILDEIIDWCSVHRSEPFSAAIIDRFIIAKPTRIFVHAYGFLRQCLFMTSALRSIVRFDRLPLFEDIDYSLQILKAGVRVYIPRKLCHESRAPSITKKRGGCGAVREKLIKKNNGVRLGYAKRYWKQLAKLHPDVVKITMTDDVLTHRINWYGAYKIGVTK